MAIVALVVFSLGVGLATRGGDPLQYLHDRLHVVSDTTELWGGNPTRVISFAEPASLVIPQLEATGYPQPWNCDLGACSSESFTMPDGETASLVEFDLTSFALNKVKPPASRSRIYVSGKPKPWLERVWTHLKRALNF
jgi:hypothetical protein